MVESVSCTYLLNDFDLILQEKKRTRHQLKNSNYIRDKNVQRIFLSVFCACRVESVNCCCLLNDVDLREYNVGYENRMCRDLYLRNNNNKKATIINIHKNKKQMNKINEQKTTKMV